jgi:hypothetical protein
MGGSRKRETPRVSNVLRQAVRDTGETLYRVSKDSGVSYAPLHRFMKGQSALSLGAVDRLCAYLGLRLTR